MHLTRYLLGFFLFSGALSLFHHDGLISDFFEAKHLNSGTILGCIANKKDGVTFLKSLSNYSVHYFNLDNIQDTPPTTLLFRTTHHLGVVIDGDCAGSNAFMQKSGKDKLIGSTHHWLVVVRSNDFADKFSNVSHHVDSNINVVVLNGNDTNCTIWDVYNPSTEHNGELKIREIGQWSIADGYDVEFLGSKYWTRKNMTGVRFTSAVVIPKQYNLTVEEYLADDTHRETNSMHRFQSVTVQHCRDFYNFTLDVKKTESWGYIVPNTGGKFDGLVGLLQRREVDFGSSPLIFKYDRLPVVDYSFGNWILRSVFIYRPPKSTASSFEIFVRPLGADVWTCTFFASILTAATLKIALTAEWSILESVRREIDTRWSYALLTTFGAFCLQGASYSPSLVSGRILTIFLFVFYVMLYQFYSGYIVSYLLMDPPRTINNLKDLLDSSLHAGIENILIDKDYFVQTTDPVALKIFHNKAQRANHSGFYEPEDGMELVKHGGFAFHIETSTAYPIIKKTFPPKVICSLEEVQMYRTQPMHTNAQKHSPFREMLNFCMLRLVEGGLMYRLRSHWDTHRPECIEADHVIEITVGLDEFYSALVMLLGGILFGVVILCFEILFFNRSKKNKGKNVKKRKFKAQRRN